MQFLSSISHKNRLFYTLLFLLLNFLSSNSFAQTDLNKTITLSASTLTVKDVFTQIEKQTNLSFVYSSSQVSVKEQVTLEKNSTSVHAILEQVKAVTALNFIPNDNQIVVKQLSYGNVSGRLTNSEGTPIEFASVFFTSRKSTITNEKGEFILKDIPEGNRTINLRLLGFETIQKDIIIIANKTTTLSDIALEESVSKLNMVVINSEKINTNKFALKETDYVARMPLQNLDNPQVYNTIGKSLIEEQIITDLDEAVRNAPGIVPVSWTSGGLSLVFRGFSVSVNARNGMETTSGRSSVDIANVERIEILKGPSGTLFGSSVSSFGGVVNLVTKRPFDTKGIEASYTAGSFNLNRITADINTPLNEDKTLLFRLNAAYRTEKSFMDYGFNNTNLIAPSLLYKVSDKLTFTIDAELYNATGTRNAYARFDENSGITSPKDIKLDYNAALYHDEAHSKTSSSKVFTQAKYQLAKNWTSTSLFSFVSESVDYSYQYYPTWLSPTEVVRSIGNWGPIYNNYTNVQENINGEFATGNIKHKVLVGANISLLDSKREANRSGYIDTVDVTTDFMVLRKTELDASMTPSYWAGWHNTDNLTLSGYAMDVIQFNDRISTMLSLRVDHFNRAQNGTIDGYTQTALAPKLGLVYQVVKDQVSVFVNYMSGFQNNAPSTQPDGSLLITDPIYANQYEGGVKVDALDKKLSTTISYYNIAISNAVRTNSDGFNIQDGQQVSKGLDVEVIATPLSNLNIIAGYSYNDNRIIKATDESIEGNKATDSPENVMNLWVSYSLQNKLEGLGIGIGLNHVSSTYRASDNVFKIPDYTLLKASVFYDEAKWRIGINANNLTNQQYWDFNAVPQAPVNYTASLTLKM